MAENDVYAKRRAVAAAKQSSGQLTLSSTAGKTVTNPNETSYSTSSTAYKASNGNVKTTTSSAKKSSTSTTKVGDTTIVNIKALGAGGNSAVSAGAKGTYDNTPKKKEPTQEEVAAAQAEYNRLMSIDLKRQQAAIEQQQKLAANSRVGMVNAGGTFLGGSETTNVRGTTAAELKLAQMQRDYNLAEETQRYTKYEKQLSALSDKDREIIQTLANYSQNPNSTKNSDGVPITQSQAINLGRIVEKSGYTQDEVKELVDAQVRVNNKADYLSKQEKFAATARGEDTILGITGKGIASAASTFENLAAGTGYLSVLRQNITNIGAEDKSPIDYYTPAMSHAAAANAARSEVSKIIIENAQAKNPDKENAGQILSFLYNTGMSMVDSGVIAASALIGIPPIVGTTLLGGAAASSTLMEAHERGLSDTQAILTATAAGVAETLFEKVGIESLLKNTLEAPLQGTIRQQIQQALKHTALQGLVEGSEEGFTSLANLITDSIINGKLSDFNQSVYSYMANGMDPDAAKRAAIKDVSKSIGLDVLGGFISGGVMAGVPNFARVASYDSAMNALAAQEFTPEGILRTAQSLNVQSEAVDKISKAVESGKTNKTTGKIDVDNAVMRQAVVDVAAASLKNNEGDVRAFVAQQLLESGETTVESTELVEAVVKGYMLGASFEQDGFTYEAASRLYGPSLSKAETALINKSDFGNDLLSLMMQLPIDLGNVNISAEVKSAGESIAAEKASAETAVSDNSTGETTVEANSGPASVVENELVSGIVGKIRAGEKVSMKKAANDILADADALAAVGVQTEGRTMPQIIKDIKAKLNEMAKAPAVQQAAETAPSEITLNGKSYDLNSFAELMREKGITDDEKIRELFNQALRASTMEGNNGTDTNVNPGQERVPDSGADGQNAGVAQAAGVRAEAGAEVSKRPQAGRPDPEVSPERQAEIDRIHGLNLATKTSKVGVSLDGKTVTEVDVNELTGDAYDEFVMRQKPELIERVSEVELHGGTVHFILGGIPAGTNAAGETVYGDGLTENGKDIWVQVDGAIPAEQLLGHEQLHFDLSNRLDREAVLGEVMDAMTDTFLNDVADRYDRPDGPYTPVLGEITSDTDLRGELMLDYLEELCCDLNGNFNRVGYDADVFSALRSQLFESIDAAKAKVSAERATANGMTKESISTVVDEHGKSMFSVATMKEDLDNYMQDLRDAGLVGEGKAMTETDLTNLYEGINKAMDYAEKHLTEIERLESYRGMTKDTRPFSPYKENSDPHYKMALDYSTLCRKRLLTQAITERLQAALGRAVTPQESVAIRNKIKALREQGKKLTVACALCYVEAARLKSPKVINEFLSNRTAALKNYYSLKNSRFKNDVYNKRSGDWKEAHGLDRTATKATIKAELGQKKLNEYNDFLKKIRENYWSWLEQADPETFAEQSAAIDKAESMDASEYLSAESLAKLSKSDPTIYDAFISKVRSATRSKAMETDVPYSRGDVNSVSDALIEQMNEESGFRHQSWSDFQAMHLLDTIAAVIELSTRGAKMHTYTKVPDMVRLLCDTGMMINMSLIPAGQTGLNEDGTLAFDDDEGMPYAEMLELRKQHPDTAGNIAIGISDEQIRALMASDLIDYIIPYHTSGLNADMRKRMGIRAWKDFTKTQNEEGGKGPALNEWFDEREAMLAVDGFEYMVEASKKYLALCAERGLTPKFKQFLIDNKDGSFSLDEENARNYWKLLVDRKMVNQVDRSVIVQKPVVPKFNTDTMLEILSNEVNSQEAIDSREAEDQIVKEILNGDGTLPKKDLEQARIIRDASVRYAIENTIGRSKLSVGYEHTANATEQDNLSKARDIEWVAFDSNQLKNVDNLNPTKNPDIRFSMSGQQNLDPELADLYNLLDTADKQFGNNFAGTLTSLMNQAKKVTTAPVQTGVERVSNMAKSQHYGKDIAAATGMTRGDWLNMLTYKAQTNKDSQNRASEILYYHDPKTGKRMFLRDVNPEAYNVLLDTLRGQDAWNAVSVDTAYMIWSELKADAIEDSSKRDDFIEWTKAIREKETAMGQGVQALNKWKNVSPAGELLHAWELISKNKKMTEAQKKALYDRILKHYGEIENISDENAMKDKIVELARERGTVNNIITKKKDSIVVRQAIRRALNTMNMRELRNLATASCMAMAADTRQVSPGEAMRTIQVLNMLSKPSTIGKNIVGNTSFYGIDFVSMNGAALLDLAVSGITGTRSVAAESMTLFNEASRKGFMRSAAEVLLDVNMDEDVNRYDLNEGRTFKQGGSLIERLLSAYERNMNFMLVTPDEFYKSAAKSTERRVQQLVNAGKIKTEDKKYAETMANGLALYRTFQDSSHISTAIQGMRDWLNAVVGFGDSGRKTKSGKVIHAFGAGDIVAPFTKVAGNLVSRGIEYSPFAIVQGVYDLCSVVYEAKAHPKTFDPKTQAKAVSEIARGLNGSAIATVFMLLVRAGLMKKADDEDDPNVKALNASEGLNSTQLNLDAFGRWISGESVDWRKGDVLLDVNSIEPLNILMSIGATINSWDETTEFRDKVWDIAGSLADASAELPVVQNILGAAEDLIRYNREPEEVIAEALLSTAVSSVVPNVVRGVAKGMDTKVRNTYGQEGVLGQAADQFKSSIPGLREKLPASLDNYGNEKEYRNKTTFGRMMNAVFNPLGINIYAQDDLSKQLEDLRKKTGESGFYPSKSAPTSLQLDKATREKMHLGEDTDRLKLTFEQRQLYQATYGNTVYKAMSDLVGSSLYKKASNAEKQEMLESCKDYATELAKKAVLGKAYEEKAWVSMAKNAKADYNITTAEFLIKRSEYSDGVLSNNKAPKTKAAVAMDIDIDRYAELSELTSKANADKDGSGGVNRDEVMSVLDGTDLTRDQKAFYMALYNKSYWSGSKRPWANPYGKPSAEAQKILDEMYAEIGAADAD